MPSLARTRRSPDPAPDQPPRMLKLTDSELDQVYAAARPLDVDLRDAFLRAVANALAGQQTIGPGLVARTCRELQRQFFDPPDTSKYR